MLICRLAVLEVSEEAFVSVEREGGDRGADTPAVKTAGKSLALRLPRGRALVMELPQICRDLEALRHFIVSRIGDALIGNLWRLKQH